ncbi:hypothetical protein [Mycoplasma phocoenae]|uniref:Lipoprotein n=1 Tax=Mycoplasma phocoenae TaxID=754517 RepID=A0A858U835_9MOLU|nr:hypothetical protein [Mycoplasma phocoenae]QJG66928.1 hypothetical protein HGG69_01140 [Mycoplasma phocoenae]
MKYKNLILKYGALTAVTLTAPVAMISCDNVVNKEEKSDKMLINVLNQVEGKIKGTDNEKTLDFAGVKLQFDIAQLTEENKKQKILNFIEEAKKKDLTYSSLLKIENNSEWNNILIKIDALYNKMIGQLKTEYDKVQLNYENLQKFDINHHEEITNILTKYLEMDSENMNPEDFNNIKIKLQKNWKNFKKAIVDYLKQNKKLLMDTLISQLKDVNNNISPVFNINEIKKLFIAMASVTFNVIDSPEFNGLLDACLEFALKMNSIEDLDKLKNSLLDSLQKNLGLSNGPIIGIFNE